MYRVKQAGRYRFECPTCGVFMKGKFPHCRGCICDLLSDREAGTWRVDHAFEKKRPERSITAQVEGIPAFVM